MDTLNIPYYWHEYINETSFIKLLDYINNNSNTIPQKEYIFDFLNYSKPEDISVVIAGHEPYNNYEYSSGLAFSLRNNDIIQPNEIKNILKEVKNEYNNTKIQNNLDLWAKQGVLLINRNIIRKIDNKNYYINWNWNNITLELIKKHSEKHNKIIYILLGKYAHEFNDYISKHNQHKILLYSYPTSSYGENTFKYSNCFLNINNYLKEINKPEIKW